MTSEMAPRPLRAGDSDRAAVVHLLRAHHLEGRLTVEEFEERVGQAQRAVTLIELGDLHSDLPERPARRRLAAASPARGRPAGAARAGQLLVRRARRVAVAPSVAREQAFEHIAPALARDGYELSVVGGALLFRRHWRPAWTILLAVFTFPIGLLALTHRNSDEIIVEIQAAPARRNRADRPRRRPAQRAPRLRVARAIELCQARRSGPAGGVCRLSRGPSRVEFGAPTHAAPKPAPALPPDQPRCQARSRRRRSGRVRGEQRL